MKKLLITASIIFSCILAGFSQTIIERTNGEKILCRIVNEDENNVYIKVKRNNDLLNTHLPKSSIDTILPFDANIFGLTIIEISSGERILCEVNEVIGDSLYVTELRRKKDIERYLNLDKIVSMNQFDINSDVQLRHYKKKVKIYSSMAAIGIPSLTIGGICLLAGTSEIINYSENQSSSYDSEYPEELKRADNLLLIGFPLTAVGVVFTSIGVGKTIKYSNKYNSYLNYKLYSSYIHDTPCISLVVNF